MTLPTPNKSVSSPTLKFPHILYGGDYNPEQWPEEIWLEDALLMREAGVNFVSLGVFSWSKLEPRPDEYDFAWLDRLMDLLHEHGVRANLATPTASPPAWLVRRYPEILPVTDNGTTLWHGSRRHYCPHSSAYHDRATKIGDQTGGTLCKSSCLSHVARGQRICLSYQRVFLRCLLDRFREWLKKRYGSLDKLNHAWGTAFWSQHYGDWNEIHPPRKAPAFVNPTQQLDWARFNSDSVDCLLR